MNIFIKNFFTIFQIEFILQRDNIGTKILVGDIHANIFEKRILQISRQHSFRIEMILNKKKKKIFVGIHERVTLQFFF